MKEKTKLLDGKDSREGGRRFGSSNLVAPANDFPGVLPTQRSTKEKTVVSDGFGGTFNVNPLELV